MISVGKFLAIFTISLLLFTAPIIIDRSLLSTATAISVTVPQHARVCAIHNLRDEAGHTWQLAILNTENQIHLRLVGYPLWELDHSQPLTIGDKQGNTWAIADLHTQESAAFNVAEYNLQTVLSKLPVNEELNLTFYLTGDRQVQLQLAADVVREWRQIALSFQPMIYLAGT